MPELRISDQPICDFCSEPKWGRIFHCDADFSIDRSPGFPELPSKGDWLACSACALMIDVGNWTGLLLRSVDRHSEKFPHMPRRILVDTVKRSHDLFREHYLRMKHAQAGKVQNGLA